jgi:hypothetical protein
LEDGDDVSDTDDLRNLLLELEIALQTEEVRSSEAQLRDLLAQDFREFGRSGRAYTLEDVVTYLTGADGGEDLPPARTDIADFQVVRLSETIAFTTYRGSRESKDGISYTNRSSIWRLDPDGRWRMVFHQGTPTE